MSPGSSDNTTHDYIVQALQPGVLAEVAAYVRTVPSINVIRSIGPADAPHTLIVSMSESDAESLTQRFAGRLIVERDRPLTPFA